MRWTTRLLEELVIDHGKKKEGIDASKFNFF